MKPLCFFGLLFFPQRIPLVPRISASPENATIKPKLKALLKGKIDPSLEGLESNFEVDEKIVLDTWQQASLTISHMVAAEVHQRLIEEEKESPPVDSKEKSPQLGTNKKAKKEKEAPKKKKTEKKAKGIQSGRTGYQVSSNLLVGNKP